MAIKVLILEEFADEIELMDGLKHISRLIEEGYTSGIEPTWVMEGKADPLQQEK